ncbi:hypothetical protein QYF36_004565 [Acer negundo]|nr:hypothetical protein QYF36_004565 [Acer negundo]
MALTFLNTEGQALPPTVSSSYNYIPDQDDDVPCTQDSCQDAMGDQFTSAQCADGPDGSFCSDTQHQHERRQAADFPC